MSVIEGEGRVPIIYGSYPVPGGIGDAYLARPDLEGRFPALLLLAHEGDPMPVVKDLARRLARYEFGVTVPGSGRAAALAVITALGGAWAAWTAPGRMGLVALGAASDLATEIGSGSPLVAVAPPAPLTYEGPSLLLGPEAHEESAGSVRVAYRGVGGRFWDDSSDEYHAGASRDAFERIVGFLERQLAASITA